MRTRLALAAASAVLALGCGSDTRPRSDTDGGMDPSGQGGQDGGPRPPVAVDAADAGGAATDSPPVCLAFTAATPQGKLSDDAIAEASGLAASRAHAGVLWVHNDSGDGARVFAIDRAGTRLGTFALPGATAVDWEDTSLAPVPGAPGDHLYVADTGDNAEARKSVSLYRFPEPEVAAGQSAVEADVAAFEAIEVRYGDGKSHNAEALFVDPASGEVVVVTKEYAARGLVFRAPPIAKGVTAVTLELVAPLVLGATTAEGATRPANVPAISAATGGSVSPAGNGVLLRTTAQIFFYPRAPGEPVAAAFARTPCEVPHGLEIQGEAVAFAPDGKGYFTVSEGKGATVYHFAAQ